MSMKQSVFTSHSFVLFCTLAICCLVPFSVIAQQPAAGSAASSGTRGAGAEASQQGIYLLFPFENAGASPRLDWLGEGLEELTILRLSAAGESVYSHSGRINELDRYGLPPGAKLSRATMLRIAEDLDVDYVVYGSFSSDGVKLSVQSRILRVNPPALLPVAIETGPLDSLMDLQTKLAWRSLSTNDRSYPLSLAEF